MDVVKFGTIAATAAILAACNQQDAITQTETGNATEHSTTMAVKHKYAEWEGKWIGVEGMFVEITRLEIGKYNLIMQSDLDTLGTYDGTDGEQGIKFTRNDQVFTLRKATGDETGLKYLAGKSDCLMVMSGEGYCRD